MFLFLTARDMLAAATRLNIVGPLLAVRVQASLHSFLEELVTRCKDQTEMRQVDPLLDVLQGAHEKLYCRLFIS
jgi:urease accessory protein UreF